MRRRPASLVSLVSLASAAPLGALASLASVALVACGLVFDVDALGPDGVTSPDAPAPTETGPTSDAASDTATSDVLGDAGVDASDGRGPTGLDERVALPDLGAPSCSTPAFTNTTCGRDFACRFATPDSGRCEDCTPPRCMGRLGSACTKSFDCEPLYTCFRGHCTSSCLLGGHECGAVDACLAIGYAGGLGLCDPSTLP